MVFGARTLLIQYHFRRLYMRGRTRVHSFLYDAWKTFKMTWSMFVWWLTVMVQRDFHVQVTRSI